MSNGNGANLGFEDKLWSAADKLRGTMDAAEYKHVVLGLIFLKYISDAFLEKHNALRDEPMPIPKIATNTPPPIFFGYLRRRVGQPCRARPKIPKSGK